MVKGKSIETPSCHLRFEDLLPVRDVNGLARANLYSPLSPPSPLSHQLPTIMSQNVLRRALLSKIVLM
jgi:hypothetical protein